MDRVFFTSSTAPDETEIVELGNLVLHNRGAVSELAAAILVVAGPYRDEGTVADVVEGDDLERDRQRLVRSPVRRQRGAQYRRTSGLHEIAVARTEGVVYHAEALHAQRSLRQMHLTLFIFLFSPSRVPR